MQETNEKFILTFENVYKENSYKGYQIDDLTDFKSESVDEEMVDIKEDIIANIKKYLNIETDKSSLIYKDKESIVEGDFPLDYTIEKVDVVFHDHYTYDSYNQSNVSLTEIADNYIFSANKEEELNAYLSREENDGSPAYFNKFAHEFMANTESYIAKESACFISNYYYTVDVVITLTKSIF